jgi:HAD superfamily hydrolase (TIGR01490 family)
MTVAGSVRVAVSDFFALGLADGEHRHLKIQVLSGERMVAVHDDGVELDLRDRDRDLATLVVVHGEGHALDRRAPGGKCALRNLEGAALVALSVTLFGAHDDLELVAFLLAFELALEAGDQIAVAMEIEEGLAPDVRIDDLAVVVLERVGETGDAIFRDFHGRPIGQGGTHVHVSPGRSAWFSRAARDMRAPMAASYFDVDGTLVQTNLIRPTLYYLLNQPTPLASARKFLRALLKAPQMALGELQDRRVFNEILYTVYEGVSEDRLLVLAREVYERVVRPSIFPGTRELIAKAREAGHQIVLISGELECILVHLKEELGADELIANRIEMKDGISTGKIMRPVVAGPTKAALLRRHARAAGHDLEECFAYSDSFSDVPMLSVVGHPTAVHPDRKLRLLATTYGWPLLDLERAGARL